MAVVYVTVPDFALLKLFVFYFTNLVHVLFEQDIDYVNYLASCHYPKPGHTKDSVDLTSGLAIPCQPPQCIFGGFFLLVLTNNL